MEDAVKLVQYFRDLRHYPFYNRVRGLFYPVQSPGQHGRRSGTVHAKIRERSGWSNENTILRWIRSPSTLRGPKASSLKPNTTIQSVRMSCSTWRYSASLLSM
jgi:hypothetical protein